MPYKSDAQRRKFHVLEKEGKISPKVVNEFDQASKGMNLPERIGNVKHIHSKDKHGNDVHHLKRGS